MSPNKNLFIFWIFLTLLLIQSFNCADDDDDTQDDWLHVEDCKIVDKNGNEVWLTGVNWFGFNVGSQIFDGVWSRNLHEMLTEIADHGFNLLRVPVSTQILLQWKNGDPDEFPPKVNAWENEELCDEGKKVWDSFRLWTQTMTWCKELGIKIMIDVHCAQTSSNGHVYNMWYNGKYTTKDWIDGLVWVADHYKNDDTILALDLKNEPHGKSEDKPFAKWDGSTDENNWKYAAETCALKVLEKNPNLLIMIEGIEVYPKEDATWESPSIVWVTYTSNFYNAWWGGNFRGVKENPIDLGKYQSQLVYSPHDYGPLVWKQPWFEHNFTMETIMDEYWRDTWFFILEDKIAPLLIGEWGGFMDDGPNEQWMVIIRDLMIKHHIHHTFWCFNENSGDTGGLVYDNFGTWDEKKYGLVKPSLWQDKNGKFISLDHKRPVGANGISLGEYYGEK